MILLAAAMIAFSAFAQEKGTLVLSDNFGSPQATLEHWRVEGAKVAGGQLQFKGGGWIQSRFEVPANFYATFDVTITSPDNPNGNAHIGMSIERTGLYIAPTGQVWPYGPALDGFSLNKRMKLTVIRKCGKSSATYICLVDGKEVAREVTYLPSGLQESAATSELKIDSIDKIDKLDEDDGLPKVAVAASKLKPLMLTGGGVHGFIENFEIYTLKGGDDISQNRALNGGLEYLDADGSPYYIMRSSLFQYSSGVPVEQAIGCWVIDDKEKHSGKYSVRMTRENGMNPPSLGLWPQSLKLIDNESAVLSVYLKADQPDLPVTLYLSSGKTVVNVGTEWKRYELKVPHIVRPPPPYSYMLRSGISFSKFGATLWVDDLQIEVGDKATPYQPSGLDKLKCSKQEPPQRPAPLVVPLLPDGVTPGVDLDLWTAKALRADKFLNSMKPAAAKTEAWLACDSANLYIGMRAYVENLKAVKPLVLKHDDPGVFGGEGIELFMDPLRNGEYIHFGLNSAGSYAETDENGKVNWDGNWKREVRVNENGKCIDYFIALPFSDFAHELLDGKWFVNLARNSAEKGAACLGAWYTSSYKQEVGWPEMMLPAGVVGNYKFGVNSSCYSAVGNETVCRLALDNQSGKACSVKAVLSDSATGDELAVKTFTLKQGIGDVSFVSKTLSPKVMLRLFENDRLLLTRELAPKKKPALSLMNRLSFYMKEDNAVFRAETLMPEPEKLTAVLECAGQKTEMPASAKFKLSLPLKNIPDGTHKATLKLLKGNEKVAEAETELIKRPYREHATQINRFSRSLIVDGKPFFPFSPLVTWENHPVIRNYENPEYAETVIDFWMKHGFKSLDVLAPGTTGEQRDNSIKVLAADAQDVKKEVKYCKFERNAPVFLNAANKKGLKVMLWTKFREEDPQNWGRLISEIYDQPCVISHRVEDEADAFVKVPSPEDDELRAYIEKTRPLMPYVPTYMNYTPGGVPRNVAGLTSDILMCDPYVTNSGDLWKNVDHVLADIEALRGPGIEMGKPSFVFLVGYNMPNHFREITGGEQIAQTYGSITLGCTGLSYFIDIPTTLPHWKALKQLNQEVLALTNVICSEEETPQVSASEAKLRHITKKSEGYLYVISVNTAENGIGKVTFTLPVEYKYDGKAEVMFEERKLDVNDGKFTDEFPRYTRHVYKVKIK